MKNTRQTCKECPWENRHKHSEDWKRYAKKMTEVGKIKDSVHKCHMISSDTWGYDSPIDSNNACIGALKQKSK